MASGVHATTVQSKHQNQQQQCPTKLEPKQKQMECNNSVQQNWNPNKNKWNVAQRKPTGDKNENNSVNQQRYNNSNQPRYNYRQRNSCFRSGNVGHWKNECTVRTRTRQGTTSGQGTTGKLPSKIRTKTTKPMGGLANYINYKQKVNKYKNIYSINNTERNRNQLSHL